MSYTVMDVPSFLFITPNTTLEPPRAAETGCACLPSVTGRYKPPLLVLDLARTRAAFPA